MPDQTEVLVAGAGPVGLTAALELTRRGVRARIVDAASGPATTSRAIATHPRTLETYDQMGIADEMIARGLIVRAFTMYSNGSRLIRLDADYTASPTQFPFTVAIDQVRTEEVLREALARHGVEVEWDTALTGFDETPDGVLSHTASGASIPSAWLIGCDGGHSTVRKQLGLPLTGEVNETWLIADALVDTDLPRNSIYWIHTSGGTLMMAPLPGARRWRMLDTVDVDYDGDAGAIAARFTGKLSVGTGVPVVVEAPAWVSVFTAQQRMVPAMQSGRVFVAGDAAHVHSPASGQGMNTGIQEAYNLAWKLAMVIRGWAGADLLDTYSQERVPVGAGLLESTRTASALVALKNRLAGVALPVVFAIMRRVPPMRVRAQRTALGRVSGLDIGYPRGPLTTTTTGGRRPAPGDRVRRITVAADNPGWQALRAELRDVRWTLLAFGAEAAALAGPWGPALSVRTVAEDAADVEGALIDPGGVLTEALGAAAGGWILIRPDGYVAARGDTPDPAAVRAALAPAHLLSGGPVAAPV
ncbi:FAD-dependent monooxygenase [Amorphoplanes nipponensis]|uniref:Oxygenase n=1 Tax=Actinoplanes nipponensis TaxID=135950 RepID=A0A919MRW9_9ACTN|nr:FAD-dependent monooxygenase [Actinoplanes nipponensis]GIE47390.1 oxygenase [Actinoplanes nipponensis]